MELTDLELEFLQRLTKETWVSPPLFDHSLVARLVEVGYVRSEALPTTGAMYYEITDAGRDAIS
jgi:DNA-binding PadR family transcriptional regulator